jgi:hypothetical protein
MKKIIIIGSRRRNTSEDYHSVYKLFRKMYNEGDIIVSGGCLDGADHFAELIAGRHGMTQKNGQLKIYKPEKPHRGSPRYIWAKVMFDRNTVVAKEVQNDSVVIACVVDPKDGIENVLKRKKGGTEDTLKKIHKFGFVDTITLC